MVQFKTVVGTDGRVGATVQAGFHPVRLMRCHLRTSPQRSESLPEWSHGTKKGRRDASGPRKKRDALVSSRRTTAHRQKSLQRMALLLDAPASLERVSFWDRWRPAGLTSLQPYPI